MAWRGAWEPARGGARVSGLHVLNTWSGWIQRAGESAAARSLERRNRGGAWRRGVEEGEGHQRGVCGAMEVPGRAAGIPDAARTAGGREPAAVELEVEESRWGLICKNRKVQGLHCKINFPTDLGLN